jgi:hypothetical protein
MGEIASYHKKDRLSPCLWALQALRLLAFLWPLLFCLPWDGFGHHSVKNKIKKNK